MIVGNALDPVTLNKAMVDVESVFHVGPSFHTLEAEMGIAAINAASAAGVEHLSMIQFYTRKLAPYCSIG